MAKVIVCVVRVALTPVPLNATVCGLLLALVLMVKVPVCNPAAVGVKLKTIWQAVCAGTVAVVEHVVAGFKVYVLEPDRVSERMVSAPAI